MLEGIFQSSHPTTISMIFFFVMKFLQPVASLLARLNIESNVAVASLRLFELISRKADLTEEWALGEKQKMQTAIAELLTNYKRWNEGALSCNLVDVDTNGEIDDDEPFVDVCYLSDMLVNMIHCDTQQTGNAHRCSC